MKADPFKQTMQALLAPGGHRVWSLIVTLFGDLAQDDGIDGLTLSAVMTELEVRPEAVRVALHRLRNEGWITSEKVGRTRRHALTPKSRAQSATASTRIYAPPASSDEEWQLALTRDTDSITSADMLDRGFAPLMSRVYVGAASAIAPKNVMVLRGGDVPVWLGTQIAPAMLTQEYRALLPALQSADRQLKDAQLSNLQIAVLRCLVVHNWRRIVLRHPPLPRSLLPDKWEGHQCHILVNRLLDRFPRPLPDSILPS